MNGINTRNTNYTNRTTKSIQIFFNEIQKIKVLSKEEEYEVAKLAATGDKEAQDKLVKSNLRFVVSVAKRYANGKPNRQLIDMVSQGTLGLIAAAERFNPYNGNKFISYAVWWIRQSIMQFLNSNYTGVRIPENQAVLVGKKIKFINNYYAKFERDPSDEEVRAFLKLNEKQYSRLNAANSYVVSTSKKIKEDSDVELGDFLFEELEFKEEDQEENVEVVKNLLKYLSAYEKQVITRSFGIGQSYPESLEEIAESLGKTRERIRQVQAKGLMKLRAKYRK